MCFNSIATAIRYIVCETARQTKPNHTFMLIEKG